MSPSATLHRSWTLTLVDSLYFNGLAPLDLQDLLAESTFCSALSLRTLKAIFGDPFPLRPYHFNSLVKLCVNLEEIIVSGEWQGEPVSGTTSSQSSLMD